MNTHHTASEVYYLGYYSFCFSCWRFLFPSSGKHMPQGGTCARCHATLGYRRKSHTHARKYVPTTPLFSPPSSFRFLRAILFHRMGKAANFCGWRRPLHSPQRTFIFMNVLKASSRKQIHPQVVKSHALLEMPVSLWCEFTHNSAPKTNKAFSLRCLLGYVKPRHVHMSWARRP